MGNRTPLYEQHLNAGAKIVDFSGWDMPLHYGSQVAEHHQVRNDSGMFDVSHMTIVDFSGPDARAYLRNLLANNVDRLKQPGKALYTCMLNEHGGVIDDLIVYFVHEDLYRIVFNAGTRVKVLDWVNAHVRASNILIEERTDLAMIAVQGPSARERVHRVLAPGDVEKASRLTPFNASLVGEIFIARTGYTGEDGYELMTSCDRAIQLWCALSESGVQPTGLGARDTLRLEAGMSLYGVDMDESTTPLESGLGWTVAWEPQERDFIGRRVLELKRADELQKKLVGLVLLEKGVLRNHQKVAMDGQHVGEITSGSFSPTLGKAIALARVPRLTGDSCQVEVRGKLLAAKVVKPPFVRHGKSCVDLTA